MNCDQAGEKLIDLAYGELDAAEARLVEEHISTCPTCREEFEKLQLARAALSKLRCNEPTPEEIRTRTRRMIEHEPSPTSRQRTWMQCL